MGVLPVSHWAGGTGEWRHAYKHNDGVKLASTTNSLHRPMVEPDLRTHAKLAFCKKS